MTPLEFVKRCATDDCRIVSSGDLTALQIAEARSSNRFYVDEDTGLGFVLLPWSLTTKKDRDREREYFRRNFVATD